MTNLRGLVEASKGKDEGGRMKAEVIDSLIHRLIDSMKQ
jgi:hypothetical protein